MNTEHLAKRQARRHPLSEQEAEDCLEPLAQAGDLLHAYVVGTAALVAKGAGDWVDVLEASEALITAQRKIRSAHQHLINAMADPRARLTDPLEAAAAVSAENGMLLAHDEGSTSHRRGAAIRLG